MKKIVSLLFLASLFVACGSDDTDPTPPPLGPEYTWQGDWNDSDGPAFKPEYKEKYYPVYGEWQVIRKNGKAYDDFLSYQFSRNAYSTLLKKPPSGIYIDYGHYSTVFIKYNDKQFKEDVSDRVWIYSLHYANNNFQLTMSDGQDTYELVSDYLDVWSWRGDWNDPENRFYQIYQGKYNPVKGTWKRTHHDNGVVSDGTFFKRYEDGLVVKSSYDSGKTYTDSRRFAVNDIGLKEGAYASIPIRTYRYRLAKEDGADVFYLEESSYESRYIRVD